VRFFNLRQFSRHLARAPNLSSSWNPSLPHLFEEFEGPNHLFESAISRGIANFKLTQDQASFRLIEKLHVQFGWKEELHVKFRLNEVLQVRFT